MKVETDWLSEGREGELRKTRVGEYKESLAEEEIV